MRGKEKEGAGLEGLHSVLRPCAGDERTATRYDLRGVPVRQGKETRTRVWCGCLIEIHAPEHEPLPVEVGVVTLGRLVRCVCRVRETENVAECGVGRAEKSDEKGREKRVVAER